MSTEQTTSGKERDTERESFEKAVSGPPYDHRIDRLPPQSPVAWGGEYEDYAVGLAWCMWSHRARLAAPAPESACWYCGSVDGSCQKPFDDVPCRRPRQPSGKYDEVLRPFFAFMEAELHANCGKGDRPGWLTMTREQGLLEIYYHVSKLQKAVRDDDAARIRENTADVANMAMMLLDVCGGIVPASVPQAPAPEAGLSDEPWASIKYLLDSYPGSVRVRPKGGQEELLGSLCTTFIALRDEVLSRRLAPAEPFAFAWFYPNGKPYTLTWGGEDAKRVQGGGIKFESRPLFLSTPSPAAEAPIPPAVPAVAVEPRHSTNEFGDCAHWCKACATETQQPDAHSVEANGMRPAAASDASADAQDAERYRFLNADAYQCVVPHGNRVNGSRTGWVTHIHPGETFDAAIDAALAAMKEQP